MNENIEYRRRKKQRVVTKKRKNPLVLVFDENARREFLTGFRKRKLQRRNKANEEFEKKLKLERKRIKNEAKESYKKLLLSRKPIPQLEDLLAEEIDMGTHSVSITELSTAELARKNNCIGINEVEYENPSEENSCDNASDNLSEVEGMEVRQKKKSSSKDVAFKNSKDIKKLIRQQATTKVKNSKVFKKKTKLEHFKFIKQERKKEKKRRKKLRKKQMSNV